MASNNTEQIYEIAGNMLLKSRNISFAKSERVSVSSYETVFLNKWHELDGNEKAFIATMCLMGSQSSHPLLFKMQSSWFMSHKTYHKVRNELVSKHVIHKLGNTHRNVLNPDYHPKLDSNLSSEISKILARIWYKSNC